MSSTAALRRLTVLSAHIRTRPTLHTPTFAKLGSALSSSQSPAMVSSAKEIVDSTIKDNNFVMFGKSYCPYCHRAKKIMEQETDELKYLDIDLMEEGSAIQQYLKSLNGQGTVPHVYIRQEFIGGCSDLQAIPNAKLKKLIKGADA